jgi:hypothetical protein
VYERICVRYVQIFYVGKFSIHGFGYGEWGRGTNAPHIPRDN